MGLNKKVRDIKQAIVLIWSPVKLHNQNEPNSLDVADNLNP